MPLINIAGTLIQFPDSSSNPNWSPAIVQFAQAVESALSGLAGSFDVAPQTYTMVASVNNNIDLPGLSFPPSQVLSVNIGYSILRDPDTAVSGNIVVQSGTMTLVYNADGGTGEKWTQSHEYDSNASVTFDVSDIGQVSFSSTSLGVGTHAGQITYYAKSLTTV